MADNVTLDAGAGGDTIAADDVAGVKFQAVKIDVGADGVSAPLGNSNPIPVSDAGGTLTVDGTVAVTNGGLTELAAAINASSQMDVNIAASNATITVGSHAVTNIGTFAVQVDGAALTSLQLIDDPVATLGTTTYTEAATKGTIVAAVRRDADTTLVDTTNELGPLQMDANGRLKVEAFSGETLPVSGTVTANLAAGTNNIGDVDVLTVPADPFGANADAASATGSISAKLRFIAATGIPVTGTVTVGSHAVTNAGTFVVQENGAALTALQLIDDTIFADDAGFTLSTHKVTVAGGVAVETDGTDPTSVAEADAAALRTDRQRTLLVNQTNPRFWHVSADYGAAQTNVSVKATPGASLSLYITDLVLSNGATAGNITLLDGSGGTVLFELYPAINGGVSLSLRNPIKLTANTALCLTSSTVTTHTIFVAGYIAP